MVVANEHRVEGVDAEPLIGVILALLCHGDILVGHRSAPVVVAVARRQVVHRRRRVRGREPVRVESQWGLVHLGMAVGVVGVNGGLGKMAVGGARVQVGPYVVASLFPATLVEEPSCERRQRQQNDASDYTASYRADGYALFVTL